MHLVGSFRTGVAGLLTLVASSACHASLPGPATCDVGAGCTKDHVCILGRCRPPGTIPVSTLARRVTLAPSNIAVSGAGGPDAATEDPLTFAVAAGAGEARVFLDWPVASRIGDRPDVVQRALVVLEGHPSSDARPGKIAVDVSEIVERWEPRTAARPASLRTGLPMRLGTFTAGTTGDVVVDITELVRSWLRGKPSHGVVLSMSAVDAVKARFRVDPGSRPSPRLDVYLAPDGDGPEPRPIVPPETEKDADESRPVEGRTYPDAGDEETFE